MVRGGVPGKYSKNQGAVNQVIRDSEPDKRDSEPSKRKINSLISNSFGTEHWIVKIETPKRKFEFVFYQPKKNEANPISQ